MNLNILPNGNLEMSMDPEDREDIADMVAKYPNDQLFLHELLVEHTKWSGNNQLYAIDATDVGGLTEAPIVCDDVERDEDGKAIVRGKVWWYPQYECKHFGEELLEHGRVVFTFAPTDPA